MFFGIPVYTDMTNFYAWSPSDRDIVPEWISGCFLNEPQDNYIIYTQEPMKKFLVSKDEVIIRCGVGSAVFFLILKKTMMQNWWHVNQKVAEKFEVHRPLENLSYQEYAEKNIF